MIFNALRLALRTVRRNLVRSLLTVLGVVIGVAAVITMVTLGNGVTAQVTKDIASLGTNVLMVRPGQGRGPASSAAPAFKMSDVEAVVREVSGLEAVSPVVNAAGKAVYADRNWSTSITGTDNNYFLVRDWATTAGRTFTESELRAGSAVCVLGTTVEKELFGVEDPIGQRIRIKGVSLQVIGVLESKGQSTMGSDQDDLIIVPVRTVQRRIAGNNDVSMIQLSMRSASAAAETTEQIKTTLRRTRHVSELEEDDFMVFDMAVLTSMLTGTTNVLTGLLGAVAAISLLVGGIGIMNIMLVSVTERTREIGVRLAIGALERDVLTQFLVEAIVLSSIGGIVGIALAMILSFGLTSVMNVPFVFDPGIIVVAFLFSAGVGVVFGYFPARKAARLDPIEALRHE